MRSLLIAAAVACLVATPARADVTAVHHSLEVRLSPAERSLSATDTITIEGGGRVVMLLAEGLTASSITLDGVTPSTRGAPGGLRLDLGADGTHELIVVYAGDLATGAGVGGVAGGGRRPVADPEGAYLPSFSGWHPMIDQGPATWALTVTTPAGYRAVATGRLVAEEETAEGWSQAYESIHADGELALFAGPWTVTEKTSEAGHVARTWFEADLAPFAEPFLDDTLAYMALYAERFGDYPFDRFHVVSGPQPVGLGFPNLTYLGARIIPLPFVRSRSLAHEVAHVWWGNGVTADYATGNWTEGLATYVADHFLAERKSPAAARDMRLSWLRDYGALPDDRDQPLTAFQVKEHTAAQVIGYGKAAMVFHMLRGRIGAEAFDQGLRQIWQTRRFQSASWQDLRAAFEAASGRDLSSFFEQWVERSGAPRLTVSNVQAGKQAISFDLAQAVAADQPPYQLRVPVRIETAGGAIDSEVRLDAPSATFTIPLPAFPVSLTIDPDFAMFRRLAPGEAPTILRDVTLESKSHVLIAASAQSRGTAEGLAARLLEAAPSLVAEGALPPGDDLPLLIIGEGQALADLLTRLGLPEPPLEVAGQGTARVWTGRSETGRAYAVIAANDAQSMALLARPLPHYGGRSYLVFDGAKASLIGVWQTLGGPLHVDVTERPLD